MPRSDDPFDIVVTRLFMHLVLVTRRSAPYITVDVENPLHRKLATLVREQRCLCLAVGGGDEHVHLLVRLRASVSVDAVVAALRDESTSWVRRRFPELDLFAWDDTYAAFAVSDSDLPQVRRQIRGQARRHAQLTFREEFVGLLRENGIEYKEEELPG
jgi:putative transposase